MIKSFTELPLFLGLTEKEMSDITKQLHLGLHHHKKGTVIAREGDICENIIIVADGWVECETYSDRKIYHFSEIIQAPFCIEAEKLFGLSTHYQSTYKAHTTCDTIIIPKESLAELFKDNIIVRINLLNIICRRTQQLERQIWHETGTDLKREIALFIKNHSHYPAGKKILFIKMAQFAEELNVSRLEVSIALNQLADEEKIILRRGMIEVPALQLLI